MDQTTLDSIAPRMDHAHKLGQEAGRTALPIACFDVTALLARDLGRSPVEGEVVAFGRGFAQAANALCEGRR